LQIKKKKRVEDFFRMAGEAGWPSIAPLHISIKPPVKPLTHRRKYGEAA